MNQNHEKLAFDNVATAVVDDVVEQLKLVRVKRLLRLVGRVNRH